jgi:YD repeat-containing protein
LTRTYAYDHRGLQTQTASDPSGLNAVVTAQYDAFGRATQTTDANGNVRSFVYDRLGRVVATTDPSGTRTVTYDAFSRTLTQVDGLANQTTYAYNDTARTITVTTPENIVTTTARNRLGETLTITDGRTNVAVTYVYDKNGNVKSVTNAAGSALGKRYDNANRVIETTDANGVKTTYVFDAANRVLTRTVDPSGLNLVTTYTYDGKGQTITVTDANGTVTQTTYDLNGHVLTVTVDPTGLNLRTTFTYGAGGNQLTVTEGVGSAAPRVTQYTYDILGRRTQQAIDPSGLNIRTSYTYDKNGNVVTRTDANGNVTRYYYDGADRLIYTLNSLNGLTACTYDAEGRYLKCTVYATALTGLSANPTASEIATQAAAIADSTRDQTTRHVYDKDGREVYTINALWNVTKSIYDANGNLLERVVYNNPIAATTTLTPTGVAGALSTNAADRSTRIVYDAANRAVYAIDSLGAVTESVYDANGNAIRTVGYATPVSLTGEPTVAQVQSAISPQVGAAANHVNRNVYDAANRVAYRIDAEGYALKNVYDKLGQVTQTIRYPAAITVTDPATPASIAALLPGTVPTTAAQESFAYDKAGRLTDRTDGEGFVTHNVYDALGQLTDTTRGYGTAPSTTHYDYDKAGRLTDEIKGYVASWKTAPTATADTRYAYDAAGNRTTIIDPRGVDLAETDSTWALAARKALNYVDASGNVKFAAALTAAEKQALLDRYTTHQVFDALGHKIQTTDALGGITKTDYDSFGNAAKVTDPNGNAGYFYFDQLNRSVLQVDPEGYIVATGYNAYGDKTQLTQYATKGTGIWSATVKPTITTDAAHDQITALEYDKLGHLTKNTDAEGNFESYTYDAFGNRKTFTNKLGGPVSYTYDRKGNLKTETLPIQSKNAGGTLVAVVNQYDYDARGNRIKVTEAVGLPEQRITPRRRSHPLNNRTSTPAATRSKK